MKTFLSLALLCVAFIANAQLPNSAVYRGEYFGLLLPSPACANERLAISLTVYSDGSLEGRVRDWNDATLMTFDQSWPFFADGKFTTDITGLGNTVRGKFNKTGVLKGTVQFEDGCRYTYTAYRRYRIQP